MENINRPLNENQRQLMDNMLTALENKKAKAVSFEMNDMLVLRALFDPHDIAFFMERDFSGLYTGKKTFYELRLKAEEDAVARKKESPVTMDDIYDRLVKISKISPSSRDKLMKRECELEEHFCFPRRCGTELYNAARANGKKIIITADTYLPRKTVEKMLENCGYKDYEELFITSECGCEKSPNGDLYSHICEKTGIKPEKILHIGCDYESDAEASVKQGMKSLFVTSCRDRLIKSGRLCGYIQKQLFFDFCSVKYISLRCIIALYAAYAFDFPHGKIPYSDFCGDEYMAGFIMLGPLGLYKDFVVESGLHAHILESMDRNGKMEDGAEDFKIMYGEIFRENLDKYGFEGCSLPFFFYADHGAKGDRIMIQNTINPEMKDKWEDHVTEPELAPVRVKNVEPNMLYRLADRMFPRNSYVRRLADGIIAKIHIR